MLKRRFKRLFWRIGEVVQLTGLDQPTLRQWEQQFKPLRPRRDSSGVRVYRERDLRIVLLLQQLIERDGCSEDEVVEVFSGPKADLTALLNAFDLDELSGEVDARLAPTSGPAVAEDEDESADDNDEEEDDDEDPELDTAPVESEPLPVLRIEEPVCVRKAIPRTRRSVVPVVNEAVPEEQTATGSMPLSVHDRFALSFIRATEIERPRLTELTVPQPAQAPDTRFALDWVTPRDEKEPETEPVIEPEANPRFALQYIRPDVAPVAAEPVPEPVAADPKFALPFVLPRLAAVPLIEPESSSEMAAKPEPMDFDERFALSYVTPHSGWEPEVRPVEPPLSYDDRFALAYIRPDDDLATSLIEPEPEPVAVDERFALAYIQMATPDQPDALPLGTVDEDEPPSVRGALVAEETVDAVDESQDRATACARDERFALAFITPQMEWEPEPSPSEPLLSLNERFALAYIQPDEGFVPPFDEPDSEAVVVDERFALSFIRTAISDQPDASLLGLVDEDEPSSVRGALIASEPGDLTVDELHDHTVFTFDERFALAYVTPHPGWEPEPLSVEPPLSYDERFALSFIQTAISDQPTVLSLGLVDEDEPSSVRGALPRTERARTGVESLHQSSAIFTNERFALEYIAQGPPVPTRDSEPIPVLCDEEPVSVLPVLPPPPAAETPEPPPIAVDERFALLYTALPPEPVTVEVESLGIPGYDEPLSVMPPLAMRDRVPVEEEPPVEVDSRFALAYVVASEEDEPDLDAIQPLETDEPVSVMPPLTVQSAPPDEVAAAFEMDERFALRYVTAALPEEPEAGQLMPMDIEEPVSVREAVVAPAVVELETVPGWLADELRALRADLAEVVATLEEWSEYGSIEDTDAMIDEIHGLVGDYLDHGNTGQGTVPSRSEPAEEDVEVDDGTFGREEE